MSAPGQAGHPRGLVGRLLGQLMTWHNAQDNRWTLDLLELAAGDRLLEIGFGPGMAVELACRARPDVSVAGIDHSAEMLRAANARNRRCIEAGRVRLELGSVDALPYGDASFDKALAVNSIYFWNDPVTALREILRVLSPGGVLAVTVRDRQREAYRPFDSEALTELLRAAGFASVDVRRNGDPRHPLICALGWR